MKKDNNKMSVVIATYNRNDIIVDTLNCLANQTLDPEKYEIIVIDDGSPDNTEEVVKSMINKMPYKLRFLKHKNQGPGFTQNRGIREAKYPIVCLIADDILLDKEALQAHLEDHIANPEENTAILGRVLQSPELIQSVFLQKWNPFKFNLLKGKRELPYYMFWACNISVKKDFLLNNGLYSEDYGKGGAANHEDVELGYRLSTKGLKILYNEKALGYHYHLDTLDNAYKRAYSRGINWKEFKAKIDRPDLAVKYHVLNFNTIKDHIDTFTKGPNSLIGVDRNPFILIIRQIIRVMVFNFFSINLFWLWLLRAAEKNSIIASIMNSQFYRGVISYYFFKGIRDNARKSKSKRNKK